MLNTSNRDGFSSLRKQAKQWLRSIRQGDAEALARLGRHFPHYSHPPVLREVQQALAREHGFGSWAQLKEHYVDFAARSDGVGLVDVFLEHACIFTPKPDFVTKRRRAERIRARHPSIATSTLHTAIVSGEVDHVRALLDADPSAIRQPGGRHEWAPILFACYGRLPNPTAQARALDTLALLLDRGADPNAYFVSADEWKLKFTALAGVMGQGEMGQPEHPQADEAARLLLSRGAHPNDGQAIYNTHLSGDDPRWLDLLIAHGLDAAAPLNWHADSGSQHLSGLDGSLRTLDFLVAQAAANGHRQRLEVLLKAGANPNAVSHYTGKTAHQSSVVLGDSESAALLERFGARVIPVEGHDAFVAAARSGDIDAARRLLEAHPQYAEIGDPLTEAAHRGETEMVRRLLEAGVDANAKSKHGHRALNNASDHLETARVLLDHGADPQGRAFGGTPTQWAYHASNPTMARFFAEQSRSLLDALRSGHLALVTELLTADPTCIEERDGEGNGPLHALTVDANVAELVIPELLKRGVKLDARNAAGQTAAEHLDERGYDHVADLLEASA